MQDLVLFTSKPALLGNCRNDWDSGLYDFSGRIDVLLHQQWRQRQHLSHVVKSVTRIIWREQQLRVDVVVKQVFDRIAVLNSIEPTNDDVPRIGVLWIDGKDCALDPILYRHLFLRRWLIHIARRHQVMP